MSIDIRPVQPDEGQAGKTVTAILCTYPDKTGLYDKKGFQKGGQDHTGGWYMVKTVWQSGGKV